MSMSMELYGTLTTNGSEEKLATYPKLRKWGCSQHIFDFGYWNRSAEPLNRVIGSVLGRVLENDSTTYLSRGTLAKLLKELESKESTELFSELDEETVRGIIAAVELAVNFEGNNINETITPLKFSSYDVYYSLSY